MPEWLVRDIADRARAGETTVAAAARLYQLCPSRIYRRLESSRRPVDAPLVYTARERELAFDVAAVLMRSMPKMRKGTISTKAALGELVLLGRMTEGELSVRRANQLLSHFGISPKFMRREPPCVNLQALHPNHVHEADFTQAAFVYLDNLTVRYHRELTKKAMPKTPIQLGVVKDHYSRAILAARAYPARAENAADTLRLLYDAWNPKLGTSGLPHGCPWMLYTDQGPGFTAGSTKSLCKALLVSLDPHSPGNSRATGLVENTIRQLASFQRLIKSRMCRGVSIDLDRLNGMMQEWAIDQNALPHPEYPDTTRAQVWHQIQHDQIRQCPPWDVFVKLSATTDEPRKVQRDGCVKFNNLFYYVGSDYVDRWVYAYEGPNKGIYVMIPNKGTVGPIRSGKPHVAIGTFAAPPLTEWERNLRLVDKRAEELGYTADDVEYRRKTDEVFIPDPGRPIVDDQGSSERFYSSVLEAKSALADTVDLADLPHEIVEEIERTLESKADAAGCISTEVVDRIAALVSTPSTGSTPESGP